MAKKIKYPQTITPLGTFSWARLKVQEEWKGKPTGKYSLTVQFPEKETQEFLTMLEGHYKKFAKSAEAFKDFKPGRNTQPNFGEKEDKDGNIVFKVTTKAEFTNSKTGETMKRVVPVFDAKGKPIDVNIGNGTRGKIAVTIVPKAQDSKNYGVSLWMDAVQVVELVEYGAGSQEASQFGFGEEEGYEAESETPFDPELNENPEEEENNNNDF